MNLGFVGLGNLGRAVADRLNECGHFLSVWNRSPARTNECGYEVADTPSALAEKTDIIFLCLFDSKSVRTVFEQEDGLLAANITGKIIIDLTTNHYAEAEAFHDVCQRAGAVYLEAPVLGSVIPASQGALTVLVSGDEGGYKKALPVLEDIGKNIFYLQEPGLAARMKLINNMVLANFMATLAEALAFGEDAGIERENVLEILAVGGGNSLVLNAKRKKLLEEDFSTHFSTALIYKDLHCLQDLAYENKKALFTGSLTKELYAKACEKGLDQMDFSAIYHYFKHG